MFVSWQHLCVLVCLIIGSMGIQLNENSSTVRIWSYLKSKGGALLLERPNESGEPDTVKISLHVSYVRAVDETKMELVFDLYCRFIWMDQRLSYEKGPPRITIPTSIAKDLIWTPDLFFANAHDTAVQSGVDTHSGVFISSDGQVKLSSRLTVSAHCDMDLHKFPHDKHICGLDIESYMFSAESVKLEWGSVSFKTDASSSVFACKYRNKTIKIESVSTGDYQRAIMTIDLIRINSHYSMLLYAPSIVLLLLSMMLFWLPLTALLERTLLGAILLFCMTIIMAASQYGSPQVGYAKAVDIWVVGCFVFLSVALLEVMALHLMFGRKLHAGHGDHIELVSEEETVKSSVDNKVGPFVVSPDIAYKIDLSLRILYPVAFVLFNIIYWPSCT